MRRFSRRLPRSAQAMKPAVTPWYLAGIDSIWSGCSCARPWIKLLADVEMEMTEEKIKISLNINNKRYEGLGTARTHLADFMRNELGLTGTHVGCEHGVCGACTVLVDGQTARGCLMLAVQAQGMEITTIEGLAPDPELSFHPIQQAFHECQDRKSTRLNS